MASAPPSIAAQRDRLASWSRGYSPLQVSIAGLLAVVVIIGGLSLLRSATAEPMGVLYANLSSEDAGAVTEQLTATGIPFELASGGSTVMVPVGQVDTLRLTLASEGLPKSSIVGYELLDNQALTTSSFREAVNYQRALEGELSRTLMSMDGVEAASVRLVLPKEKLFTTEYQPATAAVQLTTTKPLTESQTQAITHLVASSVPELSPDNVTITDSTGRLLAGGTPDTGAVASDQLQAQVEARLSASADTMLSQVLGPDKAVVRVSAVVSREDQVQQSEVYDPDRMAIGSQTTSAEEYNSDSTDRSGGVVTPAPDPAAAAAAAAGDTSATAYTNDSTATENLVSRTVTEVKTPSGEVSRLTVAVAIDETVVADVEQIQQLVSNAVGLDAARGDTIVVTKVAFVAPEEPAVVEPPSPLSSSLIPTAVGAALLVLISLGLLLRLRSRRSPIDESELAGSGSYPPPDSMPMEHRVNKSESDRLRDRIDGSPQEAANVLRGWLADDATKSR